MAARIYHKWDQSALTWAQVQLGCNRTQMLWRTECSQTLLPLPAVVLTVRNNRTIPPVSGHANIYCLYMRCPLLHLPSPFPENQRSLTWARSGQTRFQSAAVCSMYIDEFLTLYIRTVQLWYSYSHSGFCYFLVFFNQLHSNSFRIELENLKVRFYRWAFVLCFALRAGSATVKDQNCETWLKPTTGLCFLLHVLDPNGWRDVSCCKGSKSHTDYLDFYEWKP